jgi:hypothetical protein
MVVVMLMVMFMAVPMVVTAAAAFSVSMLVTMLVVMVVGVAVIVAAAAALAVGVVVTVLVIMVVVMVVVAAAAIRAVDVLAGGARHLAGGPARLRGGEQVRIDLGLGVPVVVLVPVIVAVGGAVGVGVRVLVVMRVAMRMVVRVVVPVAMVVARGGADAVGAALGGEGRLDEADGRAAHLLDHFDQDVIVADPERVAGEFGGGVAVAEVPGDAGEFALVGEAELGEALRPRRDGDDAAVLEREAVAGGERRRLGEVEQEFEAALGVHHDAPAAALVIIEHDGIDGGSRVGAGGENGGGAEHLVCLQGGPMTRER